jgi:riboflavin synthase
MFTGLIEDIGEIESVESGDDGARLRIATRLGPEIATGDSVSVNGVCLTAVSADSEGFEVEAMKQTLSIAASAMLAAGDRVNLELAMRPSDRLGGHIVQGHVDGVGEVIEAFGEGFARRLRVGLGPSLMAYLIPQGSIALDGVSLTVAELTDSWVGVSLIPETLERTNLDAAKKGSSLNVECDVIAKYVERLAAPFAREERR